MLTQLLTDLRTTGDKRPLAEHIGGTLVAELLAAGWVQRSRETLRAEYTSQLWGDLDRVLDRLAKNDKPADQIMRICRQEFAHTRKHIYAFAKKGNRGHVKVNAMRQRGGGSNPTARDREVARTPIYDDPTISQYRREPSTHYESGISQAAQIWPELRDNIELLGPYIADDHERELWLDLWFWFAADIGAQIRYVDAAALIDKLRQRRDANPQPTPVLFSIEPYLNTCSGARKPAFVPHGS